MLTHLYILNFAIVDNLELDFTAGMTVLTGETGAGKSIIIDALGLALGERADPQFIRHGQDQAEIRLSVALEKLPMVGHWLQQQGLTPSDHNTSSCLIRRVITRHKRSRAYINHHPVSRQQLQALGNYLIDIYGQHEHQSLLKPDQQLILLDHYGGNPALVAAVATAYQHWKTTAEQWQQSQHTAQDQSARLELLAYQIHDLQQLNLQTNELEQLNTEHKRLANADQLLSRCHTALELLHDREEYSVEFLLSKVISSLSALGKIDHKLQNMIELMQQALIQVEESSADLRQYQQQLELDPERLQAIEQRMGLLHEAARKYRCLPGQLLTHLTQLQQEYASIQQRDANLEHLQQQMQQQHQQYLTQATQLSQHRQPAALELAARISQLMAQLNMAGHFEIQFQPLLQPSPRGLERIEFRVSSNPGQPPQALTKVASGGELSRISLAIQVIAANSNQIPTLVFDEVDVGIGGKVAEIVGQLLRQLGNTRQIFCITHLPQVAAQGQHHLQVNKQVSQEQTQLHIDYLTPQQRVDEIARMLGGIDITAQTKSYAAEMINRVK